MRQLALLFVLLLLGMENPYTYIKANYISETLPLALRLELTYSVPVELTLAQSALESGWGQSYNARYRCNYFGITTKEGYYKVFNSKEESFDYYGRLMSNRYSTCLSTNYKASIKCIYDKGYAEDLNYPQKLMKLVRQVNRMV